MKPLSRVLTVAEEMLFLYRCSSFEVTAKFIDVEFGFGLNIAQ